MTTTTTTITANEFIHQMEKTSCCFWTTVREHGLRVKIVNPDSNSQDPSYHVWVGNDRVYVGNPESRVFERFAYIDNE